MVATAARRASRSDVRIQAVAAALRPEVDCLEAIVPLLADPAPEVRRAAVLALGPARDGRAAVADDELLRCLHDSDAEVRRLCEMGLRSRGRSPRDIRLGRRYAAPDPAERQKLLIDLADEEELDVTVWLERLTADADPAVRAGAARVAVDRRADLGARLEQMSRSDPDANCPPDRRLLPPEDARRPRRRTCLIRNRSSRRPGASARPSAHFSISFGVRGMDFWRVRDAYKWSSLARTLNGRVKLEKKWSQPLDGSEEYRLAWTNEDRFGA